VNPNLYAPDPEEVKKMVALHKEWIEKDYLENQAPVDPAKWRGNPGAWAFLKETCKEM
jgi:hypothetical protein